MLSKNNWYEFNNDVYTTGHESICFHQFHSRLNIFLAIFGIGVENISTRVQTNPHNGLVVPEIICHTFTNSSYFHMKPVSMYTQQKKVPAPGHFSQKCFILIPNLKESVDK